MSYQETHLITGKSLSILTGKVNAFINRRPAIISPIQEVGGEFVCTVNILPVDITPEIDGSTRSGSEILRETEVTTQQCTQVVSENNGTTQSESVTREDEPNEPVKHSKQYSIGGPPAPPEETPEGVFRQGGRMPSTGGWPT